MIFALLIALAAAGATETRNCIVKCARNQKGKPYVWGAEGPDSFDCSGLVMYWTLNNLFSLIKNIFAKLKNAQLVLSVLMALVGVAGLIFVLFIHPLSSLLMNVVAIVMMLLFILSTEKKVISLIKKPTII